MTTSKKALTPPEVGKKNVRPPDNAQCGNHIIAAWPLRRQVFKELVGFGCEKVGKWGSRFEGRQRFWEAWRQEGKQGVKNAVKAQRQADNKGGRDDGWN